MTLTAKQLRDLRTAAIDPTGNRVSAAMDALELTQAALAEAVGLTQPYISDVCRGRHSTITVENARKFAEFFGCSIEDLFPAKATEE